MHVFDACNLKMAGKAVHVLMSVEARQLLGITAASSQHTPSLFGSDDSNCLCLCSVLHAAVCPQWCLEVATPLSGEHVLCCTFFESIPHFDVHQQLWIVTGLSLCAALHPLDMHLILNRTLACS
jgi:hypothetical protein